MKSLFCLLLLCCSVWAKSTTEIKVDQIGYLPGEPKLAMVASTARAGDFFVRRANDNAAVFEGKLSAPLKDEQSGDSIRIADFTIFNEPGRYYLEIPGIGTSWRFPIEPNVYARAYYLAMRSFYGQRCGTDVDLSPDFPEFKYSSCHSKGEFHSSAGKKGKYISAKGWHDAGDYGRYLVNSGIATGTLLWTYELFGDKIGHVNLNIPESGDKMPDILDEIRWNLDWMLSMQDPSDGGAWHKQTSEKFAGFVMPARDEAISYVIGTGQSPFKSSCATANLAAVTAIAARVFEPFDRNYANKNLAAARRAWNWLDQNPNVLFKNPPGVSTGEYGDRDCGDERLWAAVELWRTTGEGNFENFFLQNFGQHKNAIRGQNPPSWNAVAPLAVWTYLLSPKSKGEIVNSLRREVFKAAEEIVSRTNANAYRISLTTGDFVWGSNAVLANYAMQLLIADRIKSDERFRRAALENLHYLLGRNTFSLSFVTQIGENAFRNPHHRPSAADQIAAPFPGLLAGGPNRSKQDPAMKKLPDLPPAKMYLDELDSYASNEIAINWNAPLVYLLAGVQTKP